jgi:hypothetical protein
MLQVDDAVVPAMYYYAFRDQKLEAYLGCAEPRAELYSIAVGEAYPVNRSGGEHISIRKTDLVTSPDFSVEVTFNAPGLSVKIDD